MRIVLKISNRPDGTATGTVVSADGSGVEIPIGMTQTAPAVLPLTFTRSGAERKH